MEKLMQYVWQHRLLRPGAMSTVDGRGVQIIDPGLLNEGSGPDFFNAKVRIDGDMWVGNVEIHVRASDWMRHGHDRDRAYDSVILHVVYHDDMPVKRPDGNVIPQMVLPVRTNFADHYNALVTRAERDLPCREFIASLPPLHLSDWLSALGIERLYAKSARIAGLLGRYNNDWREAVYVTLARALGFGTNSEPFERLAMATPYGFLARHADSELTVEAMLFGQSGLLEGIPLDSRYALALTREYEFMQKKFGLRKVNSPGWKSGRMRPQNFPHRRVALLAQMVRRLPQLMSRIVEAEDAEALRRLFEVTLSGYWATHYTFSERGVASDGSQERQALSASSVTGLLINVAIPLMHAWGEHHRDNGMTDRCIAMLQELKPESNRITAMFEAAGVKCRDAFTSQALIELRREYCEARKCLYCRIGHRMLASKAT